MLGSNAIYFATACRQAYRVQSRIERRCKEDWLNEHGPSQLGCVWVPRNGVVLGAEAHRCVFGFMVGVVCLSPGGIVHLRTGDCVIVNAHS